MLNIIEHASLRPLNTFGIDGSVAMLVEWESAADLDAFFRDSDCSFALPPKPIGQGSNLLFASYSYDGMFLRCTNRDHVIQSRDEDGSVNILVGAGCALDELIGWTCRQQIWGLENLSLIPGTVGGAAVQNVGAYGAEFGDVVTEVYCYDTRRMCEITLSRENLNYGYRDSIFKHQVNPGQLVVTAVLIKLSLRPAPRVDYGNLRSHLTGRLGGDLTPSDLRDAVIAIRRSKLPDVEATGSAGSFFRNPVISQRKFSTVIDLARSMGIGESEIPSYPVADSSGCQMVKLSAAWLIDKSGWKAYRRWNVATWPAQPLVLVNTTGYASGVEVLSLATDIMDDIERKWSIRLEPEVEILF